MFILYLVEMTVIFAAYSTMSKSFYIKLQLFVTLDNCQVSLTLTRKTKKAIHIINSDI